MDERERMAAEETRKIMWGYRVNSRIGLTTSFPSYGSPILENPPWPKDISARLN